MVIQCIASFDRIQQYCNYIQKGEDHDSSYPFNGQSGADLDLDPLVSRTACDADQILQRQTVSFKGESFGWDENQPPFLKDLEVEIQRDKVTAIIGPVGSGKSAFLNSLLGEMICLPTNSEKVLGNERGKETMAYCTQEPWLENGSIRQNIIGATRYDSKWYESVKSACGLVTDMKQLRNGDETRVGSKGLNLSGGQKQRIVSVEFFQCKDFFTRLTCLCYVEALARAIYARRAIVVLDDVFSGMDAHTADVVSSRLLGHEGLLRKHRTTVVIATHSRT